MPTTQENRSFRLTFKPSANTNNPFAFLRDWYPSMQSLQEDLKTNLPGYRRIIPTHDSYCVEWIQGSQMKNSIICVSYEL